MSSQQQNLKIIQGQYLDQQLEMIQNENLLQKNKDNIVLKSGQQEEIKRLIAATQLQMQSIKANEKIQREISDKKFPFTQQTEVIKVQNIKDSVDQEVYIPLSQQIMREIEKSKQDSKEECNIQNNIGNKQCLFYNKDDRGVVILRQNEEQEQGIEIPKQLNLVLSKEIIENKNSNEKVHSNLLMQYSTQNKNAPKNIYLQLNKFQVTQHQTNQSPSTFSQQPNQDLIKSLQEKTRKNQEGVQQIKQAQIPQSSSNFVMKKDIQSPQQNNFPKGSSYQSPTSLELIKSMMLQKNIQELKVINVNNLKKDISFIPQENVEAEQAQKNEGYSNEMKQNNEEIACFISNNEEQLNCIQVENLNNQNKDSNNSNNEQNSIQNEKYYSTRISQQSLMKSVQLRKQHTFASNGKKCLIFTKEDSNSNSFPQILNQSSQQKDPNFITFGRQQQQKLQNEEFCSKNQKNNELLLIETEDEYQKQSILTFQQQNTSQGSNSPYHLNQQANKLKSDDGSLHQEVSPRSFQINPYDIYQTYQMVPQQQFQEKIVQNQQQKQQSQQQQQIILIQNDQMNVVSQSSKSPSSILQGNQTFQSKPQSINKKEFSWLDYSSYERNNIWQKLKQQNRIFLQQEHLQNQLATCTFKPALNQTPHNSQSRINTSKVLSHQHLKLRTGQDASQDTGKIQKKTQHGEGYLLNHLQAIKKPETHIDLTNNNQCNNSRSPDKINQRGPLAESKWLLNITQECQSQDNNFISRDNSHTSRQTTLQAHYSPSPQNQTQKKSCYQNLKSTSSSFKNQPPQTNLEHLSLLKTMKEAESYLKINFLKKKDQASSLKLISGPISPSPYDLPSTLHRQRRLPKASKQ